MSTVPQTGQVNSRLVNATSTFVPTYLHPRFEHGRISGAFFQTGTESLNPEISLNNIFCSSLERASNLGKCFLQSSSTEPKFTGKGGGGGGGVALRVLVHALDDELGAEGAG